MKSDQAWSPFRELQALSLDVSDRGVKPDADVSDSNSANDAACQDKMHDQELEADARHIGHLVQMQSLCPQLEDLRILWCRLLPDEDLMCLARRYPGMQARGREPSGGT